MVWEIHTLGGGDFLFNVFNGVASLTSNDNFLILIKMVSLFAGLWVLGETALKNQFMPNIRWFVQVVLVYSLLIFPKTTVLIHDDLNAGRRYQTVSNVPLALGAFGSITSSAGHKLTELFEVAFLNRNNLSYHKTGMLFGSRLVENASNLKITNSEFSSNINSYMKQCVFYDILLGRYSLDELKV